MNEKGKKYACIILLIAFIAVLFPTVQADPSLYVSSYELTPAILFPGDTGLLTITITNGESTATHTDSDYINGVVVDSKLKTMGAIIENIYLSSDGDGNRVVRGSGYYEDVAELAPGASITVELPIIAEEKIAEGIYTPMLHIDLQDDDYHDVTYPIVVKVSNESMDLIQYSVPSSISSIGSTDLSFTLINNRGNDLNSIVITPSESEDFEVTPHKQFFSTITASSTEDVTFSLIPKTTGETLLSLQCEYKNGDNKYTKMYDFPINLSSFYEVVPIIYSMPKTITKGETAEIRLKIYNAKNEGISSVSICPVTDAEVIPSEYFIGSMDADDLYAVTFDISAGELSANKTYPIEYQITFKQDNNLYTTTPVTSSFFVEDYKATNGATFIIGFAVLLLVILLVIVLFYYRRKRRRS